MIGYPLLLISLMFVPSIVTAFIKAANEERVDAPRSPLAEAESEIVSASGGIAHGNSPEAIALAERYSAAMKSLRDELFTKRKKPGVSLSKGEFLTYCQLSPGKCAFLVHVPDYRKFDDDAQESLASLAWLAAQHSVKGTLEEGDELGVGLKGVLLYGSVQTGLVVANPEEDDGIE